MKYESLLVITYGRTGSTLLQGLLNSIDGCLIRGENFNMCHGLFQMHRSMQRAKTRYNDKVEYPFFGSQFLDENVLIEHSREMLRRMLLGDRSGDDAIQCYGFKETRYVNMPEETLYEYIDFLTRLLPQPGIIFHTRSLEDVAASGWWQDMDQGKVVDMLTTSEKVFKRYAGEHENTYQLCYEDIIDKTAGLRGMFEFLGADYADALVDQVLSRPHSYSPAQQHVEKLFTRQDGDT